MGYSADRSRIIGAIFWYAWPLGCKGGRLIKAVRNNNPYAALMNEVQLSVHPDGTRIFTSSGGSIHIRDTGSYDPILRLNAHERLVLCLGLSRNGSLLASGGQVNFVRI